MKKRIWMNGILACVLLSSLASFSALAEERSWLRNFRLLEFRAYQLSALQSSGTSFTGGAAYAPAYEFTPKFGVLLNLGSHVLLGSTLFFALDYQALASYALTDAIVLELGGGAQTWIGTGNATMPVGAFNAGYRLREQGRFLKFIERVFAGYTIVVGPTASTLTHEIKAGVQIEL